MSDRRRRKSLSIFKTSLSSLTPIRDSPSPPPDAGRSGVLKKKLRPSSLVSSTASTASSPLPLQRADSDASQQSIPSPALKGRSHGKPSRPSSIFGSIKSIHSLHSLPDDESIGRSTENTSWGTDGPSPLDVENAVFVHHGEVQIGGGMFRKKSQYLVLTETHILRFKSQAKAEEVFPNLTPPSSSSSESVKHLRKGSNSSNTEISPEELATIPIRQITAVYKLEDGRPLHTVEVSHLDEVTDIASTLTMQLQDPKEADRWLEALRVIATQSRVAGGLPYSRKAVEYAARTLESEGDYDPQHFHMYTVVQRANKLGSRSSSDDLGKLLSNTCYLVIGFYRMHLIPLLRPTKSSSSTSVSDLSGSSYGIAALSHVRWSLQDDAFQLVFRLPLQAATSLSLASSQVEDIMTSIKRASETLRPLYPEQPFTWSLPVDHPAQRAFEHADLDEYLALDRTLTAYCVAYKLDPSGIRYTVDYDCEDAPQFRLLAPAAHSRREDYTALELVSVLRSLRHNDSFNSLAFCGIKLDALHSVTDRFGVEHLSWTTRTGQALDRPNADRLSLLVQEIQNIAVQNQRLRRLDLTDCLTPRRGDGRHTERGSNEMIEALIPLCAQRLTNVDWLILNGLTLSELDVSSLYAAALKKGCEFRAIEMGGCSLSYDGLRIISEGLQLQKQTVECINISGSSAKLDESFISSLSVFKTLRTLDLSRCTPAASAVALLPFHVLQNWRLETLRLSGTPLGQKSVDDLAAYLTDAQSSNLRELQLDHCQLNGREIAVILHSLSSHREEVRKMTLDVSRNRIAQDQHVKLVTEITQSATPERLFMRSLEYSREEDFRALLVAVGENKSLKFLDISSVSLPFDASDETCQALKMLFETNNTLEELRMAGENAHLEAATIGRGLPEALKGLAANKTLRALHCQHQVLGLPGAAALASVLEANNTLLELHCEDNGISLQAFTTILNSLQMNTTLLYLPTMESDRALHTARTNREALAILGGQPSSTHSASISHNHFGSAHQSSSIKGGLKRSVSGLTSHVRPSYSGRSSSTRSSGSRGSGSDERTSFGFGSANIMFPSSLGSGQSGHHNGASSSVSAGYTEQDLNAAVAKLDDQWEVETTRLQAYLQRNVCIAQGLMPAGPETPGRTGIDDSRDLAAFTSGETRNGGYFLPPIAETSRPATAGSLAAALAKASLDRTPTAELDRQLGGPLSGAMGFSELSAKVGAILTSGEKEEAFIVDEDALIETPVRGEFGPLLRDDEPDSSGSGSGSGEENGLLLSTA